MGAGLHSCFDIMLFQVFVTIIGNKLSSYSEKFYLFTSLKKRTLKSIMAIYKQDTIFALSTPYGSSGVAIIRLSGEKCQEILEMFSRDKTFQSRKATYVKMLHPVSRETIDHIVAIFYPEPQSYTGENCAEIHCHGSPAVIDEILIALGGLEGVRQAEAGEFTRRAFENGKMDLTEAEAVADLIHAETQLQKDQALSQLEGRLGAIYEDWAGRLKKSLAYLEASIDFADEELPDDFLKPVLEDIKLLNQEISEHLNDNRRGEMLREGVRVAVVGAPNAGKSTLVNALAQRDVALVSDIEGTTRDIIEVHLNIAGIPVVLSDTAGLRPEQLSDQGQDKIEREGIKRALERAQNADLTLLIFDGAKGLETQQNTLNLIDERSILVVNKSDLMGEPADEMYISLSAENEDGISDLLSILEKRIKFLIGDKSSVSLTRKRHRTSLQEAQDHLERALGASQPDFLAEDVRLSLRSIGRITGRVDVEDLLDVIFKDFCIGK